MDTSQYIKLCLVKKGLTVTKLAELTKQSQPNLSNKLIRNNFQTSELNKIANILDADLKIQFIDRTTGEPIV